VVHPRIMRTNWLRAACGKQPSTRHGDRAKGRAIGRAARDAIAQQNAGETLSAGSPSVDLIHVYDPYITPRREARARAPAAAASIPRQQPRAPGTIGRLPTSSAYHGMRRVV